MFAVFYLQSYEAAEQQTRNSRSGAPRSLVFNVGTKSSTAQIVEEHLGSQVTLELEIHARE